MVFEVQIWLGKGGEVQLLLHMAMRQAATKRKCWQVSSENVNAIVGASAEHFYSPLV